MDLLSSVIFVLSARFSSTLELFLSSLAFSSPLFDLSWSSCDASSVLLLLFFAIVYYLSIFYNKRFDFLRVLTVYVLYEG